MRAIIKEAKKLEFMLPYFLKKATTNEHVGGNLVRRVINTGQHNLMCYNTTRHIANPHELAEKLKAFTDKHKIDAKICLNEFGMTFESDGLVIRPMFYLEQKKPQKNMTNKELKKLLRQHHQTNGDIYELLKKHHVVVLEADDHATKILKELGWED